MGLLLMLATVLAGGAAAVAAVAGGYLRRPALAHAARAGVLAWGTVYLALLIGTSLASRERILAPGDVKRFCGFYLDCHIGAALVDVRRTPTLGAPPNEVRAAGEFYVVTLRVTSNARRATLRLHDPRVTVVDDRGHVFHRSALGERALANAVGPALPLDQPVPGDAGFTTPVVFDLPRAARSPKLLVTDGPRVERIVEQFLIGDEDSFLHRRTYMALAAGPEGVADGRRR